MPIPPIVVTYYDYPTDVGFLQQESVTASCKAGEQMLSGGYTLDTRDYNSADTTVPGDLYYVYADYPSGPSSWTVSLFNQSKDAPAFLAAFVTCATNRSANPTIVEGIGGPETTVHAICPSQTGLRPAGLTGGGYQIIGVGGANDVLEADTSYGSPEPSGPSTWTVHTTPEYQASVGSNMAVVSYAVCSGGLSVAAHQPVNLVAQTSSAAGAPFSGEAGASCNRGEVPIGAGWMEDHDAGNLPLSSFYTDYTGSPPTWHTTMWLIPGPGLSASFRK